MLFARPVNRSRIVPNQRIQPIQRTTRVIKAPCMISRSFMLSVRLEKQKAKKVVEQSANTQPTTTAKTAEASAKTKAEKKNSLAVNTDRKSVPSSELHPLELQWIRQSITKMITSSHLPSPDEAPTQGFMTARKLQEKRQMTKVDNRSAEDVEKALGITLGTQSTLLPRNEKTLAKLIAAGKIDEAVDLLPNAPKETRTSAVYTALLQHFQSISLDDDDVWERFSRVVKAMIADDVDTQRIDLQINAMFQVGAFTPALTKLRKCKLLGNVPLSVYRQAISSLYEGNWKDECARLFMEAIHYYPRKLYLDIHLARIIFARLLDAGLENEIFSCIQLSRISESTASSLLKLVAKLPIPNSLVQDVCYELYKRQLLTLQDLNDAKTNETFTKAQRAHLLEELKSYINAQTAETH